MIKIRASSLSSYADCPRRSISSYRKTVMELGIQLRQNPPNVAAAMGTACHSSVQYQLCNKINEKPTVTADAVEVGITSFREKIEDGCIFDDTTQNIDHAEKQIITISKCYEKEVLPKINPHPQGVESELKSNLGDDFILSGHPDIYTLDEALRDTKTGKMMPKPHAQLGAYSLLSRSNDIPVKLVGFDYLPRVAISKLYPGASSFNLHMKDCERIAYNIITKMKADVRELIDNKTFHHISCNPMSMLCNEKYCRAYGTKFCEYTRGY